MNNKSLAQMWLENNSKKNGISPATSPDETTREGQDILKIYENAALNEKSIKQQALNAQFEANKAYDLTQKYLAAQNQANGLSGLGIADTTALRASSQYQNRLSDIYNTKEKSLLENYQNAMERADTVRGEWASKREADLTDMKSNIQYATSEDAVKNYLAANGIAEGSNEYKSLLAEWKLANGIVSDDEVAEMRAMGISVDDYGNPAIFGYDPNLGDNTALALEIQKSENIKRGDAQKKTGNQTVSLREMLDVSRNWGTDMNGTYVDFNDGKGTAVYVFYNGKWYKSTQTKGSLEAKGINLTGVDDWDNYK